MSSAIQTVLVIAAPFILSYGIPRLTNLYRSYTNPPAPKAPGPPIPAPDPLMALIRLSILSLTLSMTFFTAFKPPQNLFISLARPTTLLERFVPLLRTPLDMRVPAETLQKMWTTQRGGKELVSSDLLLLSRLNTLDSRVAYASHGAGPLLNCMWCRSPDGDVPEAYIVDYLFYEAPSVAFKYLVVAGIIGVMNDAGRRKYAVYGLGTGVLVEVYMRMTWEGMRGGGKIVMLHTQLHFVRHMIFGAVILLAWLVGPTPKIVHPSVAAMVAPALGFSIQKSETNLARLKAAFVQRLAMLEKTETRDKIVKYWEGREDENLVAYQDQRVQAARSPLLDKWTRKEGAPGMAEWLDQAMLPQPSGPSPAPPPQQ